jgi:hypothetical protein
MHNLLLWIRTAILILPFRTALILLRRSVKNLPFRILLKDFVAVLTKIGFVVVPAFLTGLIFVFLPQGRDALLIVIDHIGDNQYSQLTFLLLSLMLWSGFAELALRYAIAISDNSGRNLIDERVEWRKTVVKFLSGFFLLWPYLISVGGFVYIFFQGNYLQSSQSVSVLLCIGLILGFAMITVWLYFVKFGRATPGNPRRTRLGARSLPSIEQFWLNKLGGIYDDYIYTLPKPTNFKLPFSTSLSLFTNRFTGNPALLTKFLQDPTVLVKLRVLPNVFEIQNAASILSGRGELYKWVYKIPTIFYRGLHRQVIIVSLISLALLVLIGLWPVEWGVYGQVGAPALVCTAFACYSGIYAGLLFLDRGYGRNWFVSVRLVLILLLLGSSLINNDHPVRLGEGNQITTSRASIVNGFTRWFTNYKKRVNTKYSDQRISQYPVIFVCAEGGALRTGAYTGLYLTRLEDTLKNHYKLDLRHSIFAMSGVSGGALGLGLYNALAYRSQAPMDTATKQAQSFFAHDALAPIIGKMFFGEFINLFIPKNINWFDRATALEKSWEIAYGKAIKDEQADDKGNVFSQNFLPSQPDSAAPLLVINTSEVETGMQCWISTQYADSIAFTTERDLIQQKIKRPFHYSTAINFSSRFPLFSPGGEVEITGKNSSKRHYVDGGYVENSGAASMLEILQLLKAKSPVFNEVIPIVIFLQFSDDKEGDVASVDFGNEISEIILGIYNSRQGRTKTSVAQLRRFVNLHNHGFSVMQPIQATSSSVPMNWALSKRSMRFLIKDIDEKLIDSTGGVMTQLARLKLP